MSYWDSAAVGEVNAVIADAVAELDERRSGPEPDRSPETPEGCTMASSTKE